MVYTGHGRIDGVIGMSLGSGPGLGGYTKCFTKQNPESQDEVFCYHGCAVKKMVFDVSWIGTHGN